MGIKRSELTGAQWRKVTLLLRNRRIRDSFGAKGRSALQAAFSPAFAKPAARWV